MCGRYNVIDDLLVQCHHTPGSVTFTPKSIPLMLKPEEFGMWLDPYLTNTDPLQHLLKTNIREPLLVEPVKSPANLEKAGEGEKIEADES